MSDERDEALRAARELADSLNAESCPALAAFCGGYLHEDFVYEHGSAQAAAWAYCRDAELDEIVALCREWELLTTVASYLSRPELTELLACRFGAAWQPADAAEVARVGEELARAVASLDAD